MDQQKIMWFILFLLGISFTFYFFVIDEERISTMSSLNESDIGCTLPNKDNPFMNTPFFDVAADKELPKPLQDKIFF